MTKNSKSTVEDGSDLQTKMTDEIKKFRSEVQDHSEEINKFRSEVQHHFSQFSDAQIKQGAQLAAMQSKFEELLKFLKESHDPSEPISMLADQLLASNDPDPGAETTVENLQQVVEASNYTTSLAITAQEQVNEDPNSAITTENPTIEVFCSDKWLRLEENDGPVFSKLVVQNGAGKLFAELSETFPKEDLLGIEGTKVVHHLFDELPDLFSVKLDSEIDDYKDLRLLVIDFLRFVGYDDEASRIIFDPGGSFGDFRTWILYASYHVHEEGFLGGHKNVVLVRTIMLENFVCDPGLCAIFVYILEDNDVFKRVGKRMILRDTKLMGLGSYPCSDEKISLQMLEMQGTVYANYVVDKSDLLLAFGVRFDDRVTGKLETFASRAKIVHIDIDSSEIGKVLCIMTVLHKQESELCDSNVITHGIEFMHLLSDKLQNYITLGLESTDTRWEHIKVIISDSNVPGEGEHHIMSFIREQRYGDGYDLNTRHCVYGLDADWIMLALATHEIHFFILREDVLAGERQASVSDVEFQVEAYLQKSKQFLKQVNDDTCDQTPKRTPVKKKPFQFLDVCLLTEYLQIDMNIDDPPEGLRVDLPLIDDFVFMCFFSGNDFLPLTPTLETHERSNDLLLHVYKREFKKLGGYLVDTERIEDKKGAYISKMKMMVIQVAIVCCVTYMSSIGTCFGKLVNLFHTLELLIGSLGCDSTTIQVCQSKSVVIYFLSIRLNEPMRRSFNWMIFFTIIETNTLAGNVGCGVSILELRAANVIIFSWKQNVQWPALLLAFALRHGIPFGNQSSGGIEAEASMLDQPMSMVLWESLWNFTVLAWLDYIWLIEQLLRTCLPSLEQPWGSSQSMIKLLQNT